MNTLAPRVIPVLQVRDGWLVKTRAFEDPVYLGDPINAVKIFNEKLVDELVVCDIGATRDGGDPDYDLLESIASEAFMPVAYGGGVRDVSAAQRIIGLGLEKVVLNSLIVRSPLTVRAMSDVIGAQSVVASIDVRRDRYGALKTFVSGGRSETESAPEALAQFAVECGAGEILLSSIDRERSGRGYDLDLIERVAHSVDVPLVALGGARNGDDFRSALAAGASAVAAGSRFVFYGALDAVLINYPGPDEIASLMDPLVPPASS